MESIERALGRLEAHQKETNRRLAMIEEKQDSLFKWRWKVAGFAVALSLFASRFADIIRAMAG